jgi:hypothetical protein
MNRIAVASELVRLAKELVAFGGKHVAVRSLPVSIQNALRQLRYGRSDIEVVTANSYSVAPAFEGSRAVSVTVDIWSGKTTDSQRGSWGGSNPFESRPIDKVESTPIPADSVVIAGESGGRGTFLRIYGKPEEISIIMPADDKEVEISDSERKALNIIGGIKSGYRADRFRYDGLGEYNESNPLIQSLAAKGLIKVSRIGIQITTLGRNYR